MDGAATLWYVRSRGTTSDFDRTRRSQEVLRAIFVKLISLDVAGKTSLHFNSHSGTFETDLRMQAILPFILLAVKMTAEPARIRPYFIEPDEAFGFIILSSGENILLPDMEAIRKILNQAAGE